MNGFSRGISAGLCAFALAGMVSGCSDDGDGNGGGQPSLRLFFGANGDGNCQSMVVDVQVDVADAVLARNDDGSFDCALDSLLEDSGCDVTVSELDDGDRLRITIDDCTVPDVTGLFECRFAEADLSALTAVTSAQCTCAAPGCDTTPPVCIGEDSDPGSCEDCDNDVDDDDNGLGDCLDPNCEHSPLCGVHPSTTTTTTTLEPPTTTTLPDGSLDCTITFRLADAVTAGSLQWETGYAAADGEMRGTGSAVACRSLTDGALAAFLDEDDISMLTSGLASLSGIAGPADVAECDFDATSVPAAGDFDVVVTDASDPELNLLSPLPEVIVSKIDCGSTTSSTTTVEETTTTLDGGTTTTTVIVDTTTTTLPEEGFVVLFRLDSAGAALGALQFTADYSGAPGDFQGSGAAVSCTNEVSGALFAPNDNDGTRKLTLGLIALTAFGAPADLVRCTFVGDAPVPADFAITIDDATDANGTPVTAAVSVSVTPAP